jgi:hypothetical protein
MVTIVPSFSYENELPLISSPHQSSIGPFVAGIPVQVPLWIAKTLHQRQLAQIQLPDWLARPTTLTEILQEERESTVLTTKLPYHYYEISRSLDFCLPKSVQILLQDLTALRSDKLRQNFHELSRAELQEQHYNKDDDEVKELPTIEVAGIGSYEINKVGPFLQRAFSDYGFLTQQSSSDDGVGEKVGAARTRSTLRKGTATTSSSTTAKAAAGGSDDYDEGDNEDGETSQGGQAMSQESRKVSLARSRLRRFRS